MKTDVERRTYRFLLERAIAETDWLCFAYALMSSHIHLGLIGGSTPLKDWLAPMHSVFAEWINDRNDERIGAVFVRGPEEVEFAPHGTKRLISYIHNNPVRAGVVNHPRDSDWTSHQAYLDPTRRPSWLAVDRGLELAGFETGADLDAWMENVRIDRAALDEARVVPPVRPGRPRKTLKAA
ncbi:MAG: hypothetical protein JNL83_09450 [Myxococcales bacterium]|nr:hypothetical protein [Myxococcales bacterium]